MNENENNLTLSKTFSAIFNTAREANWAFDFIKDILKKLGITEPGSLRVAVTFPEKERIHLDFCNWLIFGITKKQGEELEISIALLEEHVEDMQYKRTYFTMNEGEQQISLVKIPFSDFRESEELQSVFKRTLPLIKKRFANHSKSPYLNSNKKLLEEAVFNVEKRETLLQSDLSVFPEKQEKYFWVTADPTIWSVNKIKHGGEVNYEIHNENGGKRKIADAFKKVKAGDQVLFYESTPIKKIVGQGEVTKGIHANKEAADENSEEVVTFKYTKHTNSISWQTMKESTELQDCLPIQNNARGSLFEITQDEFETILSLEEELNSSNAVNVPSLSFDVDLNLGDLYFEDKDYLVRQIQTALVNNKHIIFTGPPGTGKSKLAKQVCESYQADYQMTTATSDWSTYETIGGYMPLSNGTLRFNPGIFLDCFKDSDTHYPLNKWLIVDEMNRADIDKAFGSLFSALTGDPITLNFQTDKGHSITLRQEHLNKSVTPNDYEYIIPQDWRLIGTINTMDKTSLYEMSYAFMRRFAFIPVSVPTSINDSLMDALLKKWGITNYKYKETIKTIWEEINQVRKIGPAIVEDIVKHTYVDPDFTSAIILYVLPQFEGLLDQEIQAFLNQISQLSQIENNRLYEFANDFFHIQE